MKKTNTRRSLAMSLVSMLVCFTMLVGTTFAWFTDSVTNDNNVIKTGKLEVGMYWADGTAEPAAAEYKDAKSGAIFGHTNWEPGFSEARHIKITNEGTLALNYYLRVVPSGVVGPLADVIDVYYFATATALERADVTTGQHLGTLAQVMGTEQNLAKTVKGNLVAGASTIHTLVLVMQTTAGDEYQDTSLGCDFSVELIATQMAYEKDSFDTQYDKDATDPAIPAALVRAIGKDEVIKSVINKDAVIVNKDRAVMTENGPLKLDTAFRFMPTESLDEAQMSDYLNWHADYVVSMDRDVAPNSIALAGYYDLFGEYLTNYNWVALSSDEAIAKNTEIRLVSLLLGQSVSYNEICAFGNDGLGFLCGAADLDGTNAGSTLTVELKIFETYPEKHVCEEYPDGHNSANCETGKSHTIGTFTYTFPKKVSSQNELNAAIAGGGTVILSDGEYTMPSFGGATDITITGTKNSVVDLTGGAYLDGSKVSFEGVTIKTSTATVGSDYAALYTPDVTYTNCTFDGPMRVGRDGARFIGCTFNNLGNDYVWTYGNDVTFEGCTFNTDGKAILVYNDGGDEVAKVVVKNCVFNSTKGAKAGAIANQNCAAIEIDNYGNGVELVCEGNTYDANFSGEWRIKSYYAASEKVVVNGVQYNSIAINGKKMTIDAGKNVTVVG